MFQNCWPCLNENDNENLLGGAIQVSDLNSIRFNINETTLTIYQPGKTSLGIFFLGLMWESSHYCLNVIQAGGKRKEE